MAQQNIVLPALQLRGASVTTVRLPQFEATVSVGYDVSDRPQQPRLGLISIAAQGAVHAHEGRIVADQSKMVHGLGYPVVFNGRHWWVENVYGDTIRYHKGPRAE